MIAFRTAAFRTDDLRTQLYILDYTRTHDPERYKADGLESRRLECARALRLWLLEVIAGAQGELARLPEEPAPLPEKVAGHISESLHG